MRQEADAQPDRSALDRMARALAMTVEPGNAAAPRVTMGPAGFCALGMPGRQAGTAQLASGARPVALAFCGNIWELAGERLGAHGADAVGRKLLERYLARGEAFLSDLRGEYCVALWDQAERTLLLATDPLRIHPLFFSDSGHHLVFASRMKALLESGLVAGRTIAPETLIDVAACSYIPSPKTVFREIQKLPPGHVLRYRRGTVSTSPHWDFDFRDSSEGTPEQLAEQLRELVREAIALRVPAGTDPESVGVFLSGGLDSSTVTGVLTHVQGRPVKSFSIGFAEPRYNETEYARIVAKSFGSRHHEYFVTPADVLAVIPTLIEAFDEPYANASAVPTHYCARLARDHGVSIMLAGDGGDELFGGNPWYGTRRLFQYYQQVPRWLTEGLLRPGLKTAARTRIPLLRKAQRYVEHARASHPERLAMSGLFQVLPMEQLFTREFLATLPKPYVPYEATRRLYADAPASAELDRLLYVDLKLVIGDNDLLKVTRMTEAAGVAVHFPLLDRDLAAFAARIPARVKMPGTELRSFYKRAYAGLLPQETLVKRKHGFGLPIPVWLRSDPALNGLLHDLLLGAAAHTRDIFRRSAVEDLISRLETDTTHYYGAVLWNLISIELWLRAHA